MWELGCEESWVPNNWCFWTVVLEKTLESPLDCKEIHPVHSKGDQPWVFFGRNDAKAETLVLWPPHGKSWLIGKDPDAGRDWGQEEKGTTEDEMAGWHHQLNGHEFEWTPGDGDWQGGLACSDSWGCKESDTTEWLNWTDSFVKVRDSRVLEFFSLPCYSLGISKPGLKRPFWNVSGPSSFWIVTLPSSFWDFCIHVQDTRQTDYNLGVVPKKSAWFRKKLGVKQLWGTTPVARECSHISKVFEDF